MSLLDAYASPPPTHEMVASIITGQCATRSGPIHGITDCRVDHCEERSPSPKMVPYRCVDIVKDNNSLSHISLRGSQWTATPIPEVRSPLKDLIPIESSASPSQDNRKGKAIEAMDKGKSERAWSVSLTISKYEGAFHGGSSAFVYNWIDDAHGNSSPEGPRESVEDWMVDRSYKDATEEPIK